MPEMDLYLDHELAKLPRKPPDSASAPVKKAYSEAVSNAVARALSAALHDRGLHHTRPTQPGTLDRSGAERRMSGGIGAKKVDVTWATEESGLILGVSIKSINFRDGRSNNFQKNLTNRRGDMLFEAVTLHRRFPYAVLGGLFFLDEGASTDGTSKRKSTLLNTHARLQLFTGRSDPAGREEQYEHLYIVLLGSSEETLSLRAYAVGIPDKVVDFDTILDRLVEAVALRNPDFYEAIDGRLKSIRT